MIGPAWEAAADLQDGDYAGAAFNGAMAVADALPVGVAAKGIRAASKGVGVLKKGSVTANAAAKQLKARGVVKPGYATLIRLSSPSLSANLFPIRSCGEAVVGQFENGFGGSGAISYNARHEADARPACTLG